MDNSSSDLAARIRDLEAANRRLSDLNDLLLRQNQSLGDLQRGYEDLFESSADGLLKTDAAGQIHLANRRALILCGATLEDLRQRNAADLLPPGSRIAFLRGLLSVATRQAASFRLEAELRPPSGQPVAAEFRVAPLMLGGEEQFLEILIENLTERRREEERLRKLEERAIVAGMSRHLSHVLRNSLTSAGGFLAALSREPGLSTRGREHVGIVLQEIRKMEEIVRGYQDYVETSKARPEERCDLYELISASVAAVSPPPAGGPSFAILDLAGGPAPALVDRSAFLLGLGYLYRGIARVGAAGRPASLEFHARVEGREAVLEIMNPGVRLSRDFVQSLDRPWRHQLLHQTFDSWDLAIAQSMFERHGGLLAFTNRPEGVACTVRLPLAP